MSTSIKNHRKHLQDEIEKTIDLTDDSIPLRLRQEAYLMQEKYFFRFNTVRLNIQYSVDNEIWVDVDERFEAKLQRDYELSKVFKGREIPSMKRIQTIYTAPNISKDYDPFKEFFENNKWDGRDRITDLTACVKPYKHSFGSFTAQWAWEKYFKRWLVAAVRCMLGEGANHVMLMLISEKHGTYKTSFLNYLYVHGVGAEHAGITEKIDLTGTNKDQANFLVEKAIWNIDDQMDNIFGKDYGSIKTFITKSSSTLRKAFGRQDKTRSRRCNFVGSVNKKKLFTDSQNRRYLAFEIEKIDFEAVKKIDINQVWLQAYSLYKLGKEQCYFDKQDEDVINAMADEYSDTPPEEDWFLRLFEPVEDSHPERKYFMTNEILSIIKNASGLNVYANKLSTAFARLGLKTIKKRIPWKDTTQARDVYVLRESFTREAGRIVAPYEMNFEKEASDLIPTIPTQTNVFVDNEIVNNTIIYDGNEYIKEGNNFKKKVAKKMYDVTAKTNIAKLQTIWENQNKIQ